MPNELVPVRQPAFNELVTMAEYLSNAFTIPKAYQRKPADIVAVGLAGQAYGWDLSTSMRCYHVIEGTASLKPEAMLALVRRHGHSVQVVMSTGKNGREACAHGKRSDNGDEHTVVFSEADAKNAGLAGKKNWQQYLDSMLQWRAVSSLCRFLFPDVVLGAGYTPEEIGADIDSEGTPVQTNTVTLTVAMAKNELLVACEGDKNLAKYLWADRTSITQTELEELTKQAKDLLVEEAEVVDKPLTADEAIATLVEAFDLDNTEGE
jgi:hypothetical protein